MNIITRTLFGSIRSTIPSSSHLGDGGAGHLFLISGSGKVLKRYFPESPDDERPLYACLAEFSRMSLGHHPHLPEFYRVDLIGGTPSVEMEFIDGISLQDAMDIIFNTEVKNPSDIFQSRKSDFNQLDKSTVDVANLQFGILKSLIDIVDAVSYIHSKGFIHRDIKPGNILLTIENNELVSKLIDFNLLLHVDDLYTQRLSGGTRGYKAPEFQSVDASSLKKLERAYLDSHDGMTEVIIDPPSVNQDMIRTEMMLDTNQGSLFNGYLNKEDIYQSDIYSLAATIYFLFQGEKYALGETIKPTGLKGLDILLQKSLSSHPARRPTAEEFQDRLKGICEQHEKNKSDLLLVADAA